MANAKKTALVCGAGGFIGGHLVKRLKAEGFRVVGVDQKHHEHAPPPADTFVLGDLRDPQTVKSVFDQQFDEVYQLAADMGGAGYVFSGENDADVMNNSALINLNVLRYSRESQAKRLFFSSSACVYPEYNQRDPATPTTSESSAYPAQPDSDYGWEKLFSERLYAAHARNYGMTCRIARYHNIFGPQGTWQGGREKAPAAMCRKVAAAAPGGEIEVWGDGQQTRSFLYIDECVEATIRLMRSDVDQPVNIGSEEMVSIDTLAEIAIGLSGKQLSIRHIDGPQGVRGRNSDNRLIKDLLDWSPAEDLRAGMRITYDWIKAEYDKSLSNVA